VTRARALFIRVAIGVCLLVAIACGGLVAYVHTIDFTIDAEDLDALFADSPYPLRRRTISDGNGEIHYAAVGDSRRPPVLFIHGTPGSWDNFAGIMADRELLERAHLLSLDRPGFGGSRRGRAEPSLERQAAAVAAVIEGAAESRPAILVGHSLGGPIAAQAAVDFPEGVAGLVLVAPSVDPELEELWWIQRPADSPLVAWALPIDLRTCNRELLPLESELEELRPRWRELRVPVTVIQGERDSLVPAANADFVREQLPADQLVIERYPDVDHFIPWTHPELIIRAVLRHLTMVSRTTI
jgi:pimeloyl-ACP methyl ester carboxylesterase